MKLDMRPQTTATFASECASCSAPIKAGSPIVKDGDAWVHATCPPITHRSVCHKCFIERSLDGHCACDLYD